MLILLKNSVSIKYIAFYLVPTLDDDVHHYERILLYLTHLHLRLNSQKKRNWKIAFENFLWQYLKHHKLWKGTKPKWFQYLHPSKIHLLL